jgi:DNA-directed RNA polymerase specialized sigma24 family protein
VRELILKCHQGEASFDVFYAATIKYWRCAAADLLRRWDHPQAVEEEDLIQEMLLAAWRAIESFDPERGDPKRHVVFSAAKTARRWLHRQRGAYGFARCRKGADPHGRYPASGADEWFDNVEADSGERGGLSLHEQAVAILESMQLAQTERDREILEAFWRTPYVEGAAAVLCRSTGRKARRAEYEASRREVRRAVVRIAAIAANG